MFGGMPPPEIFILREGFRQSFMCLLVISKGTFQALKQLIFHYFFLDTYISLSSEWNVFSSGREACRQF